MAVTAGLTKADGTTLSRRSTQVVRLTNRADRRSEDGARTDGWGNFRPLVNDGIPGAEWSTILRTGNGASVQLHAEPDGSWMLIGQALPVGTQPSGCRRLRFVAAVRRQCTGAVAVEGSERGRVTGVKWSSRNLPA